MLKQAQASPRIIKAAGEMTCEICQKQKQRKPVLPATPHVPREKWEVVSVDTFWWKHPLKMEDGSDKYVIGISFMDEASDFTRRKCGQRNNNSADERLGGRVLRKSSSKTGSSVCLNPKS